MNAPKCPTALDEMVRGYIAGLNCSAKALPECHAKRSVAWRHGWSNGRDDRLGQPRDRANVLRSRAEMILGDRA